MNAASGFPVKSTCLKAIKKGNFEKWPVFTYTNAAKYCSHAVETIKGHMVQSSQGVRSAKKTKHQAIGNKKDPEQDIPEKQSGEEDISSPHKTKELHIWDQPISKLYTGYCKIFLIRYRSGNEYIMIAYNCDSSTIIKSPFGNRKKNTRSEHTTPLCRV